jgi:hypothetical protein
VSSIRPSSAVVPDEWSGKLTLHTRCAHRGRNCQNVAAVCCSPSDPSGNGGRVPAKSGTNSFGMSHAVTHAWWHLYGWRGDLFWATGKAQQSRSNRGKERLAHRLAEQDPQCVLAVDRSVPGSDCGQARKGPDDQEYYPSCRIAYPSHPLQRRSLTYELCYRFLVAQRTTSDWPALSSVTTKPF